MSTHTPKVKPKLPYFRLPYIVRIQASRIMLWAVFALHSVAALGIFSTRLPTLISIGLWVFIAVSAWRFFKEWQCTPVYRLQCTDHQWQLAEDGEADSHRLKVIKRCYYWSPYLVVLHIEDIGGHKGYLPIAFDACSKAEFHKLRLISRYEL